MNWAESGRDGFGTRTLSVDEAFVNPPVAELEARITREAARLAQAMETVGHTSVCRRDAFVRPVPSPATSRFGTRSIFNGRPPEPA